ncbi:MAG TPA: roadblock/LC7 domain-containing protein [Gemmatimonadales bacterium]|nr:roadblock/LC7 domain-containing protein [Gemmatimonadales bacterium]
MAGLNEVVRALGERRDVATVVLASADGLAIHQAGREPADADAVAALAAAFGRHAGALTEALGHGVPDTAVLESGERLAIAARLGGMDWLIVVPDAGADAGALLYDLRRHRAALAALL